MVSIAHTVCVCVYVRAGEEKEMEKLCEWKITEGKSNEFGGCGDVANVSTLQIEENIRSSEDNCWMLGNKLPQTISVYVALLI